MSYKDNANKQINLLQNELICTLYKINNQSDKIKQRLLTNYLKWMIYLFQKQKKVLELKHIMRRRKGGRLIAKKENHDFWEEVERGVLIFNNLTKCHDLPSSLFSLINYNPASDLKVSSMLANGINPSQLFNCFIDVYYTRIDPEGYWIDKECLVDILKSSNKSLLKLMLFQTFNKIIRFSDNELSLLLNYQLNNFDQLLSDGIDQPCLENLTAITLLIAEYFYSNQRATASIYIDCAIQMKNGIEKQNNKVDGKWKEKLWEIIDLFYVFIKWCQPNELKLDQNQQFMHVNKKVLCAPTVARNSAEDIVIVEDITLFLNSKLLDSTIGYNSQSSYYAHIVWIEMETCRFLGYYKDKIIKNITKSEIVNSTIFYEENSYRNDLINEIDKTVQSTPKEYKIYELATRFQAYEFKKYGIRIFSNHFFNSCAYSILNTCKLLLLDPIIILSPQFHKLPSRGYCYKMYDNAVNIWKLLDLVIQQKHLKKDIYYQIGLDSEDFIPLVYFSINLLANDFLTKEDNNVIYKSLSNLIRFLKLSINSMYGFRDSKFAFEKIKSYLTHSPLPDPYCLSL
ncbi:hypothetical protein K502DRAFT_330149 [Neoconidiobolus thromboides FSU 785]|nr:hypothetical protein K502DRAFT_330149 [Neoconidiobolus thromboides FSU 785]